jgi:hypothetical protein
VVEQWSDRPFPMHFSTTSSPHYPPHLILLSRHIFPRRTIRTTKATTPQPHPSLTHSPTRSPRSRDTPTKAHPNPDTLRPRSTATAGGGWTRTPQRGCRCRKRPSATNYAWVTASSLALTSIGNTNTDQVPVRSARPRHRRGC